MASFPSIEDKLELSDEDDARDEPPNDVIASMFLYSRPIIACGFVFILSALFNILFTFKSALSSFDLSSSPLACVLHIMPAKMPNNYISEMEGVDNHDAMTESGYVSAASGSSEEYVPEIVFTKPHLQFLNRQLQFLEPQGSYRYLP